MHIDSAEILDDTIRKSYERYLATRAEVCGAEVDACSIHMDAEVSSKTQDRLLMFKNETHTPTEIESFGGAATSSAWASAFIATFPATMTLVYSSLP